MPDRGGIGATGGTTIRYGNGPVTRADATVRPRPGVSGSPSKDSETDSGPRLGVRATALEGVRTLKRNDPVRGREITAAGAVLGTTHSAAVGASLYAATGVRATPWLGSYTYGYGGYGYSYGYSYYCPWGWSTYGRHYAFALTFNLGWYSPCSPWYWPAYYSCWYPIWYSCYRPYASSYYAPSVYETVIYRTVYEDQYVGAAQPAARVETEPAERIAPAMGSLSIAAEQYLSLGDQAFREGRYTDAVQLYAKAVEYSPGEGALFLVLADALFAAGDYHYAAYAIRRALELDHSLVGAQVDKHEFYADPSEFDHQLAVLDQYVLDHPSDRDARLVLALNSLFGGRPAVAVDLLEAPQAATLGEDNAAKLVLSAARDQQFGQPVSDSGH